MLRAAPRAEHRAPGSRLGLLAVLRSSWRRSRPSACVAARRARGRGAGQKTAAASARGTPFDRQGMWIWYVDRTEGGNIVAHRRPRPARRDRHPLHQGRRRRPRLEPVHQHAGRGTPPGGPRRLRLAVRLRRPSGRRGEGRGGGGPSRRRLPGDRRRGPVRGQLRRGRPLRPRAARPDRRTTSRSRWPASPTSTTTRPSPTRSSSAAAAPPSTSRRCTGRRSAPRCGRSSSTPISSTASGATPIYPLGQTYDRPGRRSILRFRRFAASYGGLPPSWWDWQETDRPRLGGAWREDRRTGLRLPAGPLAPGAEAAQPRRPRRLGPGAPAGAGRSPAADDREYSAS